MGTLLLMIDLRYVVLTGVLWVSDTEHVGYTRVVNSAFVIVPVVCTFSLHPYKVEAPLRQASACG